MDERAKEYCGCLYYSAGALARMTSKIAEEEFKVTGLSSSHAMLLISVNKHPGIQPCDLSAQMLLEPSTITRLIEKLEQMDLVERQKDGKEVHIHATKQGKAKLASLQKAWQSVNKRFTDVLGKQGNQRLTGEISAAMEKFSH